MDRFGKLQTSVIEYLLRLADDLEDVNNCAGARAPSVALNSSTLGKRAVPCLIGRPLGHPVIGDGRAAFSSELLYFDPDRGIARTLSRWYRLRTKVEPEYWSDQFRGDDMHVEDAS
jgi:hypothetical protein